MPTEPVALLASANLDVGVGGAIAALFLLFCFAVLLYWTVVAIRDGVRDWRR